MSSRRNFIKKSAIIGAGISVFPNLTYGLSSKKEKLKVGLIGVGLRGTNHLDNLLQRKDVIVTAICDIDPNRIKIAEEHIQKHKHPKAQVFGKDDNDYKNLLALKEIDTIIIATPWLWHTRMSVDAMNAGKYTGVEVSAANTMEEC